MNWRWEQSDVRDKSAGWQFDIRPQQQPAYAPSRPNKGPFKANVFGSTSSKPSNILGRSQQSAQPSYGSHQSNSFGNSIPNTIDQRGSAFASSQQGYKPSQGNVSGPGFQNFGRYFRDGARSSQTAYDTPQASGIGFGSQRPPSQGGHSFTRVLQASQKSQAASGSGVGQRYFQHPSENDELQASVYEALVKIQQQQVLDLATQLAKEKVRSKNMRYWLTIRAENARTSRRPAREAAAEKRRTYGFKFSQHKYGFQI
ncbi:hypothetical protein LTR85_004991 [Meristemomyces frigidus]|nr:hypothetical protein LTR85_004991 [Meristemomyces frigidus]